MGNICFLFKTFCRVCTNQRRALNRVPHFCAEVIPRYLPDEFKLHFRMTRITMQALYDEIGGILLLNPVANLTKKERGGGRSQVYNYINNKTENTMSTR